MNIIYFQPPDINPKYCEVGYLVDIDPGYIYYLEEPCKIPASEVKIIDMERVIYDKNSGVYRVKQEGMEKVIVKILNHNPDYPTPYGKQYEAKGAYRQGKFIVVVGEIKSNSTTRIKYPASDLELKFI
jgi:hypothetical protein